LHIVKVRLERLVLARAGRDSVANSSNRSASRKIEPGVKVLILASLVPKPGSVPAVLEDATQALWGAVEFPFIEDRARLGESGACDSNAVV